MENFPIKERLCRCHTTVKMDIEEAGKGCESSRNSHCTKYFLFLLFNVHSFLFFSLMVFLLEYFLQNRRLELFKAAVPSVSSPSYFKINHSPGGNERYRKMQAVRILPGREICSAVLWLLCKVLFNDTATEGVLYYLSHCCSLQSQHCISTLLFLHL